MNFARRAQAALQCFLLGASIPAVAVASPAGAGQSMNPGTPWPATDALHRSLPLAIQVGLPQSNRFVGIFYFLWHNQRGGKSPHWDGPYDIGRILAKDPDASEEARLALWGPIGSITIGVSRCMATISAPTRGCCAATRICWPTPASTRSSSTPPTPRPIPKFT